jgi:ADP-ribose pyrophosphatase YjhB (NUDIX family)
MTKSLLVPVIAGCVVRKDGKYLLVKEKQAKAYGLWNLPAGHVDEGETFASAAKRETYEETGYKVELDKKLAVIHPDVARPVLHAYEAHVIGGGLTINPEEILEACWLTFAEIQKLHADGKLRNDWVIDSIKQVET